MYSSYAQVQFWVGDLKRARIFLEDESNPYEKEMNQNASNALSRYCQITFW